MSNLLVGSPLVPSHPMPLHVADYNKIIKTRAEVIKLLNETPWPHIEKAGIASRFAKTSFTIIGILYGKIAQSYYQSDEEGATINGDLHWQQAVAYMTPCSHYPVSQEIDCRVWLNFSTLYCIRIKWCFNDLSDIQGPQKKALSKTGLVYANAALQIQQSYTAIFHKFLFLEAIKESGEIPPESPIQWLKISLDHHPKPSSAEYREHAQLYGGELAKDHRLQEAREWFLKLIQQKEHPITYLCLGKVEDHLDNKEAALSCFEKALALDPESIEIKLWLVSSRVENRVHLLHRSQQITEEEIKDVVTLCNTFCTLLEESKNFSTRITSTFIPVGELAAHFYLTLLPKMASTLAHLQQFPFALYLCESIFDNIGIYLSKNLFDKSEIANLYTLMGVLYTERKDFEKAESFLLSAIDSNKSDLAAYQNLVALYASQKNEQKLVMLWDHLKDRLGCFKETDALASVLFNFGTAYTRLIEEVEDRFHLEAERFYRLSIEYDPSNWETRLHLARLLAITKNSLKWIEAKDLLEGFANDEKSVIFEVHPFRRFQIYFSLSGMLALCGDVKMAQSVAIEAQKTGVNFQEVKTLRSYLSVAHEVNQEALHEEIRLSIRKIDFDFRVGALINERSIRIDENRFIGYHGTIDVYLNDFNEGVEKRKTDIRQFKGEGFYVSDSRDIASYFAVKKSRDEKRGTPILLKIYTCSNAKLVGQKVNSSQLKNHWQTHYDFVQSAVDGFEAFSQFYIFENSLSKLKVETNDYEEVPSDRHKQFLKDWTRDMH